jgi:hypothetical protein
MKRELPDVPPRHIAGPVLVSVMLHGAVLLLFARNVSLPATAPALVDERASIRVALAVRPPSPAPALPAQPQTDEAIEEVPVIESVEEEALDETAPAEAIAGTTAGNTGAAAEQSSDATFQAWTPERIRAAVETSVDALHSPLTAEWIATCILERKLRGTRECEEQQREQSHLSPSMQAGYDAGMAAFAGITRPQRQRRLSEQFARERNVMMEFMDEPGVLGQIATDRYYVARQYLLYLNGNPSPYGPGNQVNCAGIGPCIYEFTGFLIEQAQSAPDENEFRVVPNVPGSER